MFLFYDLATCLNISVVFIKTNQTKIFAIKPNLKLQSEMGSMLTSMQRALERDDDVYLQLN